jgi:hypothetical protein
MAASSLLEIRGIRGMVAKSGERKGGRGGGLREGVASSRRWLISCGSTNDQTVGRCRCDICGASASRVEWSVGAGRCKRTSEQDRLDGARGKMRHGGSTGVRIWRRATVAAGVEGARGAGGGSGRVFHSTSNLTRSGGMANRWDRACIAVVPPQGEPMNGGYSIAKTRMGSTAGLN